MQPKEVKSDPNTLTLGEIFSQLRVGQLWKIAAAVIGLLTGTFALGHYVADVNSTTRRTKATVSDMKHEYFTRFARYVTAKDAERRESTDETRETLKTANDMFVDLIYRWWTKQQAFEGNLALQPEIIRKSSDPTKSRIEFADDTDWVIPVEIKKQVLDKTHDNAP